MKFSFLLYPFNLRGFISHQGFLKTVRLGNDTDTTAAVAGGLAGLRDGFEQIPVSWYERLRSRDLVEPLVQRLCYHLGLSS